MLFTGTRQDFAVRIAYVTSQVLLKRARWRASYYSALPAQDVSSVNITGISNEISKV